MFCELSIHYSMNTLLYSEFVADSMKLVLRLEKLDLPGQCLTCVFNKKLSFILKYKIIIVLNILKYKNDF